MINGPIVVGILQRNRGGVFGVLNGNETTSLIDTNIIIISCIITSITAAISMSAANYQATKAASRKTALHAGSCTGLSYLVTCAALILPFFVFSNRTTALIFVGCMAIIVIFGFNIVFYRGKSFYRHFFEMLIICAIVSMVAFFIGEIANKAFGI